MHLTCPMATPTLSVSHSQVLICSKMLPINIPIFYTQNLRIITILRPHSLTTDISVSTLNILEKIIDGI